MSASRPIILATRGSALAQAQTRHIIARCRQAFPDREFQMLIIKTTGDKLQTASLSHPDKSLPKGLFTKELEVALLNGDADLAVHSLKDLPTELPERLCLGAVTERADVRDVLICRASAFQETAVGSPRPAPAATDPLSELRPGITVGTSSNRRKAQLLHHRPDLRTVDIRGNVGTRLQKLATQPDLDATVLAAAGLGRLHFEVCADGRLVNHDPNPPPSSQTSVPPGLTARFLSLEEMLPCVGQGAIGLEIRQNDPELEAICARLNHEPTYHCVIAERAFLQAMGGGCQSPVAAYATSDGTQLHLRALSFRDDIFRQSEGRRPVAEAAALGQQLAAELTA